MTWIHKTVIGMGIVVALVPALGFPMQWENMFLVIVGSAFVLLMLFDAWRVQYTGTPRSRTARETEPAHDEHGKDVVHHTTYDEEDAFDTTQSDDADASSTYIEEDEEDNEETSPDRLASSV